MKSIKNFSLTMLFIAALAALSLFACTAEESATDGNASYAAPGDTATGTLFVDGTPMEMKVKALWKTYDEPSCNSGYRGRLRIELTAADPGSPESMTISIPFDGETIPSMPIDLATYSYTCPGSSQEYTGTLSYWVNQDPHAGYYGSSGQVMLEVERDGDVATFHGELIDVVVVTEDGQDSVTISGSFNEEGDFTDTTEGSVFSQ